MNPLDLGPRHRKQPERIVVKEVALSRERELSEVVDRADVARGDPGVVESLPVERHPLVDVGG